MEEILAKLTVFPTWIFSILMVAAVLYWLLVILGALDINLIPGGDGHGDHAGDHDPSAGHNPNVALEFLNVGKVPITVILSTIVFAGWTVTFFGTTLARSLLPAWSHTLVGLVVLPIALIIGVLAAGWCLRPLAKLFSMQGESSARDLIGRMVLVTSTTVDERFGTARHDAPTGEDMILNVVCSPEHHLGKGEQAVVMEYDRERGLYTIAPLPHTRPGFLADDGKAQAETPPASPPPQAQ